MGYSFHIIKFIVVSGLILLTNGETWAARFDPVAEGQRLTAEAVRYEHGEGVQKDMVQAFALYCEAARIGHADAQFKLGWMVANGRGTARDNAVAASLFGFAADQGHEHALRMRAFMGRPSAVLPSCMTSPELEPIVPPEAGLMLGAAIGRNELQGLPAVASIDWSRGQAERKRVVSIVQRLAPQFGIDPDFALSIITIESAFDPKAKSPKEAQGLMQLIPATAERFGVKNPYDSTENIRGGLAYLRWLLAYFKGYVPWVAAAYNAGEGNVENYKGVPPFNETRRYVERLCKLYPKNTHPFDASVVGASRFASGGLADSVCVPAKLGAK